MTTFLVPSLTSLIVDSAVTFFRDGMGLYVTSIDDKFAQVHAGPTNIVLKAVEGEAACTTGYSPFLHFDVDDMDSTIVRVLAMGAHLDGPIKYPANGKVVALWICSPSLPRVLKFRHCRLHQYGVREAI